MSGRAGRSGRPKQSPTERATQRRKRTGVAPVDALDPPPSLGDVGRRYWLEAVAMLRESNQLTKHDAHSLEAYAIAWEKWWELEEHVRNSGSVIYNNKGGIYPNPACHLQARQMDRIAHYQGKFGFTPHARNRVKPIKPPTESKPQTAAAKILGLRIGGERGTG